MKGFALEALTIIDMAPDGRGIALWKNRRVFIENTIPGEIVHAEIIGEIADGLEAVVTEFVEASDDRVVPRDDGCLPGISWQHLGYDAQLALKTDIVATLMEDVGKIKNLPIELTLPSPKKWGYAHRLSLQLAPDGTLGIGADSEDEPIRSIESCDLVHPGIMELVGEINLSLETVTTMDIHANDSGDRMIVMQTADDEAPELEITLPASVNFLLNYFEPYNMVGSTHIKHRVFDRTMRMTAGVQTRANISALETMIETVVNGLEPQPDDSVVDVFGGIGSFSAFLAPIVSYITYIDSYPPAATDAEFNLADFDNVDIVEGRANVVLSDILEEEDREPYAAAILDPPPHGLQSNVLKVLKKLRLPRLVYIGSDPLTTAREINFISYQMNYKVKLVQPIDVAPHTPAVETVVFLERR